MVLVVLMASQSYLLGLFRVTQKTQLSSELYVGKKHLLRELEWLMNQPVTLKNSRFDVNAALRDCLSDPPVNCDETETYDLVVFPPTPIVTFTGTWPTVPSDFNPVTGGMSANVVYYKASGRRCLPSEGGPSAHCPIQAFSQFQPLCGGSVDSPVISVAGGAVCTTPATGFVVTTGTRTFSNGTLMENQESDRFTMTVNASLFLN